MAEIFLSQPEESINAASELPQQEATGKPETAGLLCWILLPGTLMQLNTCTGCTNSTKDNWQSFEMLSNLC